MIISGSVNSKDLGKAKFPGAIQGSWAVRDNLPGVRLAELRVEKERLEGIVAKYKTVTIPKVDAQIKEMETYL